MVDRNSSAYHHFVATHCLKKEGALWGLFSKKPINRLPGKLHGIGFSTSWADQHNTTIGGREAYMLAEKKMIGNGRSNGRTGLE
jgi:hypothetical protein